MWPGVRQGGTAPPPLVLDHEAAALMPPRDEATRTLLTASLRSAPSDPVKALLADIERNEGVDAILAVRVTRLLRAVSATY